MSEHETDALLRRLDELDRKHATQTVTLRRIEEAITGSIDGAPGIQARVKANEERHRTIAKVGWIVVASIIGLILAQIMN